MRVASGSGRVSPKYPSRCIDPDGPLTEISVPGTTFTPRRSPAATASPTPEIVSWSVIAIVRTPSSAARSTTWVGDSPPSEAVVWRWMSRSATTTPGSR